MVDEELDWSQYETPASYKQKMQKTSALEQPQQQMELPQQQNSEEENAEDETVDWGKYQTPSTYQGEVDPTADEPWVDYLVRNAGAASARILEQGLGAVGNLQKAGASALEALPEYLGPVGKGLYALVGKDRWNQIWQDYKENHTLPSSEEIKGFITKHTGDLTKPRTKGEEKFQGLVEDVGSTLLSRRPTTARNLAVNTFGIPLAANAAKNIVQDTGFGEDKANLTKLGVWLSLSLAGNVNAPVYASNLMNQGRQGVPDTLQIDVARFKKRLQDVANSPLTMHADPRSALTRQQLGRIEQDLANGQTSVRSLMTSYDGTNALKRDRGLFELSAGDRKFAIKSINQVRDALRDEIKESAKFYPQAMKAWQDGVGAWATIHRSRAITNYVQSLAKGPYAPLLKGPAAGLFGVSAYSTFKNPKLAAVGAIAGPVAYKIGQVGYRVWNNPVLAKYYWGAINGAMAEDLPAFVSNYTKLNKKLEKDEAKEK